jgi:hypothetical protein
MPTDRPNTDLAAAVDQALTMADVRAAAAFLADHGAGFALICRVLAEPKRRRAEATTAAPAARTPRARLPSA